MGKNVIIILGLFALLMFALIAFGFYAYQREKCNPDSVEVVSLTNSMTPQEIQALKIKILNERGCEITKLETHPINAPPTN